MAKPLKWWDVNFKQDGTALLPSHAFSQFSPSLHHHSHGGWLMYPEALYLSVQSLPTRRIEVPIFPPNPNR